MSGLGFEFKKGMALMKAVDVGSVISSTVPFKIVLQRGLLSI